MKKYEELIKALRWCGDENNEWCVRETYKCPLWDEDRITDECKAELMRAAADALEAAEKRIAELSLDCELFQQKCMELDAQMKTVTECHTLNER